MKYEVNDAGQNIGEDFRYKALPDFPNHQPEKKIPSGLLHLAGDA